MDHLLRDQFLANTLVFMGPEILMYLDLPIPLLYFEGNLRHHVISSLNVLTYIVKR